MWFHCCSSSLFVHLRIHMWCLCCLHLFLVSPSFVASRQLCFVTVAFPGYLHLYFLIILVLLNPGMFHLFQLIWSSTVFYQICELVSTTWTYGKAKNWLLKTGACLTHIDSRIEESTSDTHGWKGYQHYKPCHQCQHHLHQQPGSS